MLYTVGFLLFLFFLRETKQQMELWIPKDQIFKCKLKVLKVIGNLPYTDQILSKAAEKTHPVSSFVLNLGTQDEGPR